jgi:hypothetical protein
MLHNFEGVLNNAKQRKVSFIYFEGIVFNLS